MNSTPPIQMLYLESRHESPLHEWHAWARQHGVHVCRCASFEYAAVILARLRPTIVICTGILSIASDLSGHTYGRELVFALGAQAKLLIIHETSDEDFLKAAGEMSTFSMLTLVVSSDALLAQKLALRCSLLVNDMSALDIQAFETATLFPIGSVPSLEETTDERCCVQAVFALHRLWRRRTDFFGTES